MDLLMDLARTAGVAEKIDAMFQGYRINITENRAVLHAALRKNADEMVLLDGKNVVEDMHQVLSRMDGFVSRVRSGAWQGFTGQRPHISAVMKNAKSRGFFRGFSFS